MAVTGGELAARTLSAFGVRVAFGLHGGHLDALLLACQRAGIRLVDTRHEAVAVNAADGYARVTGEIGVAFATAGSGYSNAVAGLGPARIDRSPVLLLTSSPPLRDAESNALQGSVDQVALAAPVTKWAHRVTVIEEIPRILGLAIRTALAGPPGPVVVDLPIDLLFGAVDPAPVDSAPVDSAPVDSAPSGPELTGSSGRALLPFPPGPAPEAVDQAIDLLRAARRPVLIAGSGLRGPVPSAPLVEFAEATGIPVFQPGLIGGAMPAGHPLNGSVAARNLGALTAEGSGPDLVLLAGARFGLYLGGRGGSVIPLEARVIEIDSDAAEPGRLRPFDLGITADAGLALRALTAAVLTAAAAGATLPDWSGWAATAAGAARREPAVASEPALVGSRPHPYHALREVLSRIGPGATLVIDGGELSHWAMMSLPLARPRRTMGCGYLGFLGMTPGLAIGAQVAEPDRRVVLIIGDGGAGFHPQEFDTMVRHGLPILTIVVNNACWGMSLHGQQLLYGGEAGIVSMLADTAYERVAAGFGAAGYRVDALDEIGPVLADAAAHDGPACVNLAVSGEVTHPVTEAMLGMTGAAGTVLPYYDNLQSPGARGTATGRG